MITAALGRAKLERIKLAAIKVKKAAAYSAAKSRVAWIKIISRAKRPLKI